MAVLDMLRKATADGNVDVLREGVRVLAEALIEAEASKLTGAAKGERAPAKMPAGDPATAWWVPGVEGVPTGSGLGTSPASAFGGGRVALRV